jgi:FixJ family two-component response regulator
MRGDEVVYLIDDDAPVREALSELLASHDIEHVAFGSASEYLQYTRSDRSACLILDLKLPDIYGLDLQHQLAKTNSPPIIFISGYADIPSSVRAMKAGAIEFLTKPVDEGTLITAIRAGFAKDHQQRQVNAELASLQERFSMLTPREQEVFPLVTGGMLNKQSAAILGVSEVTLQVHRGQIMRKMKAESFADLVRMAEKLRIFRPAGDTI